VLLSLLSLRIVFVARIFPEHLNSIILSVHNHQEFEFQVLCAGVVAVLDVFDSMHDAGRHVVSTGAHETATCVQYKCAPSLSCSAFDLFRAIYI
jgi:hypothetical protein